MKIRNHILMALFLFTPITLVIGQQPVYATPTFEYDFTGTVTSLVDIHEDPSEPLPNLQPGDHFIGHLAIPYDATLADREPLNDQLGVYDSYGFYSITFDDLKIQSNIHGYLPTEIINLDSNYSIYLHDLVPDAVNYTSDDLYFKFSDTTGKLFNNDYFPYGLNLNLFDEMTILFDIYGPSGIDISLSGALVEGRIDSIAQSAVPEPNTGLLLLSGLGIGIIAYNKKTKWIFSILNKHEFNLY